MTLGERIRTCRQKAGMSQEKVAERMGVSRQAVAKWEGDRSAPNTENLFKLAEIFGTTVDLLLAPEGEERQSPAAEAARRRRARKRNLSTALLIVAEGGHGGIQEEGRQLPRGVEAATRRRIFLRCVPLRERTAFFRAGIPRGGLRRRKKTGIL